MRVGGLAAVMVVGLASAAGLVSARNYPSQRIANEHLRALIYLPDARNGFYRTTRFDWSGAIGSLEYKGHTFYGPWFSKVNDIYDFGYEGPNKDVISAEFTAMVGPAEEYGALYYADAPPGGLFVKPGIGVLKRDDGAYNHSRTYPIVNGGTWQTRKTGNSIAFTHTVNEPSIGFGYVYTKTMTLTPGKPQMTIAHAMRNTGTKAIATNVYDHNFTAIDRQTTGPEIEITVPWPMARVARGGGPARVGTPGGGPAPQAPPPVDPYAPLAVGERMGTQCGQAVMQQLASPQGNKLVFARPLAGAECYQTSFSGFGLDPADYDIRIENTKTGAGVHITGDRPLTRFGFWSIRTVVAPEPYIEIAVDAGREMSWTYTYDYYTTR